MDLDDQLELEHILFSERKCRSCGKIKTLLDNFYLTRKGRKVFLSSYSYECKECTKNRILETRKKKRENVCLSECEYPDW
jgi:hypothetical protein